MGVFTPGTHGSTYGGNPLAAAVTLAEALDRSLPVLARHAAQGSRDLYVQRTSMT